MDVESRVSCEDRVDYPFLASLVTDIILPGWKTEADGMWSEQGDRRAEYGGGQQVERRH